MEFNKPLIIFDLEGTGLDITCDRIVSIGAVKLFPGGGTEEKYMLINPSRKIPAEVIAIHGITDEMVEKQPAFKQIAKSLHEWMKDCYLGGYNNFMYDNQLLAEEFMRCGIEYPTMETPCVDVGNLFKLMEPRTLVAAYKKYCNKELTDAHNAKADALATSEVFIAQIELYEELKGKSFEEVAAISKMDDRLTMCGRIIRDKDGDACWNFGKVKGSKVKDEISFGDWILRSDFPVVFQQAVRKVMNDVYTNGTDDEEHY